MLIFFVFLFSLLKETFNTCATHTKMNKLASVARILVAEIFGMLANSINKTLLDAQISEHIKKLSTTPNTNDTSQYNTNPITTAPPQLHHLHNNHPFSFLP